MPDNAVYGEHDREFLAWAARLRCDDLPEQAVGHAVDLVTDYLGCLGSGLGTSTASLYRSIFPQVTDGVHVVGLDERWAIADATRIMATAGHVLEMDDVVASASLHPGTVVMPTALAVGESVNACGDDLLAAVVAGYELMIRLGEAIDPGAQYAGGFHPTATCGTFAAALVAAKLLGGDVEEITRAVGFAGTGVGGTLSYLNDGADTKPVQVGNAAGYGATAALLNHAGVRGPGTAFEGRYGFYHAYAPQADPARLTKGLGSDAPRIMETSIKPFACCRYVQPSVGLLLGIKEDGLIDAHRVAHVRVGVVTPALEIVGVPRERKVRPRSLIDAQFSLPFCAATALCRGALMPEDLSNSLGDTAIETLAGRVELVADGGLDEAYPDRWGAWVQLVTTDGRSFEASASDAKGDPGSPLTQDELTGKLRGLVGRDRADSIVSAAKRLRTDGAIGMIDELSRVGR